MSLSAWFKSKTADKVLTPVRNHLTELIDSGSNVLEVGSGTGSFLIKASNKIERGLGIDTNEGMVEFSRKKSNELEIKNIEFISNNLDSLSTSFLKEFNISTSTLCIHEMSRNNAISTLELMGKYSNKVIVVDYGQPKSLWNKITLEMDEMISGHYLRFRDYRNNGYLPSLAKPSGLVVEKEISTQIDSIYIWVLKSRVAHNNGH